MADIPINAVPRRVQFTGNTGLGPFAFSFEILLNTDIAVYKNSTLLTITTDYTVTINVNGTGSVTLTGAGSGTALVASDYLTIIGDKPLARTTDFTTAGDLLASALNEQLDSSVVMTQQISERVDRALRQDPNDVDGDMTIPEKATRLGKLLQFNATTGNPEVVSTNSIVGSGAFNVYNFTGDGATVAFTLGADPGVENNTQVYIDGVYQQKNTYTVSGTTLTFSAAPPNLSTIEVMVVTAQPINTANAASVSFTQAGSNDTRTVQAKLEESVSVKDFGAVGDGVTDDTAAIQAAIDYSEANQRSIYAPKGTYKLTSTLTVTDGFTGIKGEDNEGTIFKQSSTSANTFTIDDTSDVHHIYIRNITIDGPGSGTGKGIYMSGATRKPVFEDLIITNMGSHGIDLDDSQHVIINRCRIRDNGGDGIRVHNISHHVVITNGHISDNTGRGIYVFDECFGTRIMHTDVSNCDDSNIEIGDGGATTDVYGTTISDCFFEGNVDNAAKGCITLNQAQSVGITGCYFQALSNAAVNGILCKGASAGVYIGHCFFRAFGLDAVPNGAAIDLDNGNESATIIAPKFLLGGTGRDIVSSDSVDAERYTLIQNQYNDHFVQAQEFKGHLQDPLKLNSPRNQSADTVAVEVFTRNLADNADTSRLYITGKTDTGLARFRNVQSLMVGQDDTHDKPGLLALRSTNSGGTTTAYYLWVDGTGDLRIHNAVPSDQDADGTVVGTQS